VKLVVNTGRAVATVARELGIKAIVNLIGAVTTSTGLTVHAELDPADYPTGIKIDDHQMNTLPITPTRVPRPVELHLQYPRHARTRLT
jgi:hypothetical protein